MSLVENLLRAQRRQCDERRRHLAELEQLAERLRADALRLRTAIDDGSGDRPTARQTVLRHATVERSITAIEIQIGSATATLARAEAELRQSERAVAQHGGAGEAGAARRRGRRKASASFGHGRDG
jgi:predicted  nucleic acid-binding Zn-ribbon protein